MGDLGALLGLSVDDLADLSRTVPQSVRRRSRKKQDGCRRRIIAAHPRLKAVQLLLKTRILDKIAFPECVHGYRKGRSHISAARPHTGRRMLLSMDIRNFYPSIRPEAVEDAWSSIGCSHDVARLLKRLTTCDYQLPQGFRTSQGLANLVRRGFDARVSGLAQQHKLTYTNYSDNLFLSGERISRRVSALCGDIAKCYGWSLHKVDLRGPGEARVVMGIVVGDRLDIHPGYCQKIEARILELQGSRSVPVRVLKSIRGQIGYVRQLNEAAACRLEEMLLAVTA